MIALARSPFDVLPEPDPLAAVLDAHEAAAERCAEELGRLRWEAVVYLAVGEWLEAENLKAPISQAERNLREHLAAAAECRRRMGREPIDIEVQP